MVRSQALTFFFALHILIMLKRGGENMGAGVGFGGGFALLVVLFILLIIIGASFWGGYGY